MINVKKGTAHSLAQSDFIGTVSVDPITRIATPAIVAGQIVSRTGAPTMVTNGLNQDSTGPIVLGIGTLGDQWGFAVTTTTEGDAIESGKVGAYAPDGNSVIETDQVVSGTAITPGNFPFGTPVYAYVGTGGNAGFLTLTSSGNQLVGHVDSIRTIFVGQTPYTLLGVKLTA